jgi:hypothetical protein
MNKHEKEMDDVEQTENTEESEESTCSCCEKEDISIKEVAYHADDKIDALIQLLIKKKLFTEHEFEEEYNALFEEDEDKED